MVSQVRPQEGTQNRYRGKKFVILTGHERQESLHAERSHQREHQGTRLYQVGGWEHPWRSALIGGSGWRTQEKTGGDFAGAFE